MIFQDIENAILIVVKSLLLEDVAAEIEMSIKVI